MADRSDPNSKLPPVLEGFGKSESERVKAMSEFGAQFEGVEIGLLDDEVAPEELAQQTAKPQAPAAPAKPAKQTRPSAKTSTKPSTKTSTEDQPNLEPVSDDAHKHRRVPTQPPSAIPLMLDEMPTRPHPTTTEALPPPPVLAPRHSPAPIRSGLFSTDRVTNMIGCAAVGLALMIFPAKQLAQSYEAAHVDPMFADLDGAIDHPLGVEAGLVPKPQTIAAEIRGEIGKTRRRYAMLWLLLGVPIGLGLSFVPRP